jgi:hypothetical protein
MLKMTGEEYTAQKIIQETLFNSATERNEITIEELLG